MLEIKESKLNHPAFEACYDIYFDGQYVGYWDIYKTDQQYFTKRTEIQYEEDLIYFDFSLYPNKINFKIQLEKIFLLK